MITATLRAGTRAVHMKWAPTVHRCIACGEEITGKKGRRHAICCNVYEAGRWVRVEFFHPGCYDERYGKVIYRHTLPPKHRSGWTHA